MPDSQHQPIHYGGQAVIEGVMIRGPRQMTIAVRAPDGRIVQRAEVLGGVPASRLRRVPVLRGIVVLYETLTLGVRALTWSSQVAAGVEQKEISRSQLLFALGVGLLFGVSLFFVTPVLLTGWLGGMLGGELQEVIAEGLLRVMMLLVYVWFLGQIPSVRRVFSYHAAEHRAIHAREHGLELLTANLRSLPNEHPRCGTAFLLTVMVIALVVFVAFGTPPIWLRIVERVVTVPIIATVAYEILRLAQSQSGNPFFAVLYAPNLWLQKLTTRDPDDAQMEVAVAALSAAVALESAVERVEPVAMLEAERPIA